MNTLLIVQFETGDSSVKYYEVPVIIKGECSWDTLHEIEDSFAAFIEAMDDDLDYEDMVQAVMDVSGLEYEFCLGGIPACKYFRTIQV